MYSALAGACEYVAPFAGAWIEIAEGCEKSPVLNVAPFAGAWIEILTPYWSTRWKMVAPFAGAWIEILAQLCAVLHRCCRSLRGSVD